MLQFADEGGNGKEFAGIGWGLERELIAVDECQAERYTVKKSSWRALCLLFEKVPI